jgi:HK97 family phage major capsid protein
MKFTMADVEATQTVEQCAALAGEFAARAQELDTTASEQSRTFNEEEREEFAALKDDLVPALKARSAEFQTRLDFIRDLAAKPANIETPGAAQRRTGPISRLPDNLHDLTEYRQRTSSQEAQVSLMRDGARKAVEQVSFPHGVDRDASIERITALLADTHSDKDGEFARQILATGSPTYQRAFQKQITGRGDHMTSEERAAIATVGTTTTGGNLIPYTFDPSVVLTSNGSSNPLRGISRVETITAGNTWKGVTSAGLVISRGPAEAQPVTESTPTFAQPSVTAQPVKAELDFSIEADEDAPNLQAELLRIVADGKDAEEADSFVNGVGTTVYPEGIAYGLAATSDVGTGGNGFSLDDIDRVASRLPDRFEPNASWLAHRAVYSEAERLARAVGVSEPPLAAGPARTLKGYPRFNSSAMESNFAEDDARIAIFGDFRQGFLIVDKVGMTVEIDPHVRDTNGKWTGQRALLVHWRNSSLVLIDNAFRALKVGVVTS